MVSDGGIDGVGVGVCVDGGDRWAGGKGSHGGSGSGGLVIIVRQLTHGSQQNFSVLLQASLNFSPKHQPGKF